MYIYKLGLPHKNTFPCIYMYTQVYTVVLSYSKLEAYNKLAVFVCWQLDVYLFIMEIFKPGYDVPALGNACAVVNLLDQ